MPVYPSTRPAIMQMLKAGKRFASFGQVANALGHSSSAAVSRHIRSMINDGVLQMDASGIVRANGYPGEITNAAVWRTVQRRKRKAAPATAETVKCALCKTAVKAVYNPEVIENGRVIRPRNLVYRMCWDCRNGRMNKSW